MTPTFKLYVGVAKLTLRVVTVTGNCAALPKRLYSSGPVCLVIVCPSRIDIDNNKSLIVLLDLNFASQNFMFLEFFYFLHFDPFLI